MRYTRHNPSPRYLYLAQQYRKMHAEGDPGAGIASGEMFPGHSLFGWVRLVKQLIDDSGSRTLLDYGSGKGTQYDPLDAETSARLGGAESVLDYWGIDEVRCYDPYFPPYDALPDGRFDGVVCTDVLEHCPEEDVPWILGEIFSYATRFVFVVVACYPAIKQLPDGTNAHCTIRPTSWWHEQARIASSAFPVARFKIALVSKESDGSPHTEMLVREPA